MKMRASPAAISGLKIQNIEDCRLYSIPKPRINYFVFKSTSHQARAMLLVSLEVGGAVVVLVVNYDYPRFPKTPSAYCVV